jgi:hypothetical protein
LAGAFRNSRLGGLEVSFIDWGVFWTAVGAVAAVAAAVLAWLTIHRTSFRLSAEAVMDTPRRAIRVVLTARGSGTVQSVAIVHGGSLDIYPTTCDEAIQFPVTFGQGEGKLYVTLRPAGSPPNSVFNENVSKDPLEVYVDSSRRKPLRIPIQHTQNEEWPPPI